MKPQANGIIVAASVPRAGKTVACAGIAGALIGSGFSVLAQKPVDFQTETSAYNHDQVLLDKTCRAFAPTETLLINPDTDGIGAMQWNRSIDQLRQSPYPVLVEAPGSVATPLRLHADLAQGHPIFDVVDWSTLLNFPIVVVTPKSPAVIDELSPALAYLAQRHCTPLAWLATQRQDAVTAPRWEEHQLLLSRTYQIPYLGELPFSPSLNVAQLQTGNIAQLAGDNLDLFPLQQALEVVLMS